MKRVLKVGLVFTMCIGLVGCGEKTEEEVVSDISAKIKEAGWEIKHDKDSSKNEDFLDLIVNNKESFSFTLDKSARTVEHVIYKKQYSEKETIGYQTENKEDDLYASYGTTTCSYNPITNIVNENATTYAFCKQEAPEKAKKIQQDRNELLEKVDITLDELYDWCAWYHLSND